jgi:programmed cell death 6-interacting protein
LQKKYGTEMWARQPSSEAAKALREQGDRLGAFLQKAEDSDGMVRSKLLEWEEIITLLSGDKVIGKVGEI